MSEGSSLPSSTTVNGVSVPTDLEGYCGWLNAHNRRAGCWVVVERNGQRVVDFQLRMSRDNPDQFKLIDGDRS